MTVTLRLADSRFGRILLHLAATARRPRNWRWHFRGIHRETL